MKAVAVGCCIFILLSVVVVDARRLLPDTHPFNRDISGVAKQLNSDNVMTYLASLNNDLWPNPSNDFQLDASMFLMYTDTNTQWVNIDTNGPNGYASPDCDNFKPSTFPLPSGGGIEGTPGPGYQCSGGDCHLLVVDPNTSTFYESYLSNYNTGTKMLESNCALKWCESYDYPQGVGIQCTSADAAGYPIAPLLFTPDELKDGVIDHAIRFTLPNGWFGIGFLSPATHLTVPTSDPHSTDPNCPYYGYRFRLKSTFDETPYAGSTGAKIILKALKTYGMYLADGGSFYLLGANDTYSRTGAKWGDYNLDTHSLFGIKVSDFEVVESDATLVTDTNGSCAPVAAPTCQVVTTTNGGSASNGGTNGGTSSEASSFNSWIDVIN